MTEYKCPECGYEQDFLLHYGIVERSFSSIYSDGDYDPVMWDDDQQEAYDREEYKCEGCWKVIATTMQEAEKLKIIPDE